MDPGDKLEGNRGLTLAKIQTAIEDSIMLDASLPVQMGG
jgi:hypothetical protein